MYKEKLNQLRKELKEMKLEEVVAELKQYAQGLDIDITIVDKEDSGIFFNEDNK